MIGLVKAGKADGSLNGSFYFMLGRKLNTDEGYG